MKALSLWQPWASAIALGLKRIETRGWYTAYRGPQAIHAAKFRSSETHFLFKKFGEHPEWTRAFTAAGMASLRDLPFGAIVAVVQLSDVLPVEHQAVRYAHARPNSLERELGDYSPGRWAWMLTDIRRLPQPIYYPGRQQLFEVDCPTH